MHYILFTFITSYLNCFVNFGAISTYVSNTTTASYPEKSFADLPES